MSERPTESPATLADTLDVGDLLERLSAGIESAPDKAAYLREQLGALTAEELRKLDDEIRKGIEMPEIFRRGPERQALLDAIIKERQTLREKIQEGFAESNINPANWSPETKETVKTGLQLGAVAGVVGLGLWVANKIRKFFSKTTEQVVEKAKTGWSLLKWIFTGVALTGLGFGAWKMMEKYRDAQSLVLKIADTEKLLVNATDAAQRRALELELAALKAAQAAQEQVSLRATEAVETVRERAAQPDVQNAIEVVEERSKELIFAEIILAHDESDWDLSDEAKTNQIVGLLQNNGSRKMQEIENTPDIPFDIPDDTEDRENRLKSGDVVLNYCDAHRDRVVAALMNEKGCSAEEADGLIGMMTLSAFLEYAARNSSAYVIMMSELEKAPTNLPGVMDSLNNLDYQHLLLNDEHVRETIGNMLDEMNPDTLGITREELEAISIVDLLTAALSLTSGTVLDTVDSLSEKENPSPTDKTLLHILKQITDESNVTHKIMLPLFHDVLPYMEEGKDPEEQVRIYLRDEMTPAEAIRFYVYHRMLSQGNFLGLPMMQLDILRFIGNHDTSIVPGSAKYEAIAEMCASIAQNGGAKIMEEWDKLDLNIDIDLTQEQEEIIKGTGNLLRQKLVRGLLEGPALWVGLLKAFGVHYTVGSVALAAARVIAVRTPLGSLVSNAMTDPEKFAKLLNSLPETLGSRAIPTGVAGKIRSIFSILLFSQDELTDARRAFRTIFDECLKNMPAEDARKATSLLRNCLENPGIASRWTALADELDAMGMTSQKVTEAAAAARKLSLATSARLRGALRSLRLPLGILTHTGWVKNLIYAPHRVATIVFDRLGTKAANMLSGTPSSYSHLPNDAFGVIDDISDALRVKIQPLRARYAGEARDAFDEAARRISAIIHDVDEIAELLKFNSTLDVFVGNPALAERALKIAAEAPDKVTAMQRTISYLTCLRSGRYGPGVMADDVIRAIATTELSPVTIGKFFGSKGSIALLNEANPEKIIVAVGDVARMGRMTGRAVAFAGAAFEIGAVVFDYMAYQEAQERINNAVARLEAELTSANGFRKSSKTVNGNVVETFVHTSGVEIEATVLKQNIQSLDNADIARLIVDSTSAAASLTTAIVAPSVAFGPAGLAIAGIVITVHTGIAIAETSQKREFLRDIPLPILAMLGTAGTVGTDERDTIANSSNWIIDEMNNHEVRKKAFAVAFWNELGAIAREYPEVQQEVLCGRNMIEFMDDQNGEFYREDFPNVIAPFLSIRLYELANDDSAKFTEFADLKIDEGFLDFVNVDAIDMRKALKEAAWTYIQHLRQKRYLDYKTEREAVMEQQRRNEENIGVIENLSTVRYLGETEAETALAEQRLAELGSVEAFGVAVSELPVSSDSRTQAEMFIEEARAKLLEGSTRTVTNYTSAGVGAPPVASGTREITTTRGETPSSSFRVHLPEGILLDSRSRDVPLWQLGLLGISESTEENPATRYREALAKAHKIYTDLFPQNPSGYVVEEHRDMCLEYLAFLQQYPEFDSDGSLREKIRALPSRGWKAQALNDDQEWIRERFEPVRQAIKENLIHIEQLHHRYNVVDRDQQSTIPFLIREDTSVSALPESHEHALRDGWKGLFFSREFWHRDSSELGTKRANPTAIHIVHDGKDEYLVAKPCNMIGKHVDTKFYIEGVGTFICRASRYTRERTEYNTYTWYFKGLDETKFYVYHENNSRIEQPGFWIENKTPQAAEAQHVPLYPGIDAFNYPYTHFTATVHLTNSEIVSGSNRRATELNALKPYLEFKPLIGNQNGRRRQIGWTMTIKDRSKIRSIELSSPFTRVRGETMIFDVQDNPEPEQSPSA